MLLKRMITILAVLGLLVATLALPAAATTAEDSTPDTSTTGSGFGTETGGDVTPSGVILPTSPQAVAKENMVKLWAQAKESGNDALAAAIVRSYEEAWGLASESGEIGFGMGVSPSSSGGVLPMAGQYSTHILGVVQSAQIKSYCCGPASGYMTIREMEGSGYTSRYDGSTLSQTAMANANHMRTDISGGTSWSSGHFIRGVNRWLGSSTFVQSNRPSASLFSWIVTFSTDSAGQPIAPDTVEFAYGPHYNGHPSGNLIGHWIVADGYYSYGATTHFADPAGQSSAVSWGYLASRYFTYATTNFANSFLQNNGVAW